MRTASLSFITLVFCIAFCTNISFAASETVAAGIYSEYNPDFQINIDRLNADEIISVPDDYRTIQRAICESMDGDLILVDPGIYEENLNFHGKRVTVASHFFTTQDPDYIRQTIIDGGSRGCTVSFTDGEDENSGLIGFTVRNGSGYVDFGKFGGGIYCGAESSPVIAFCIVSGNRVDPDANDNLDPADFQTWNGGGIACFASSPTILNCSVTGNSVLSDGGGIFCSRYASPTISRCIISGNSAARGGGISSISLEGLVVSECRIFSNEAYDMEYGDGGGVMIANGTLDNCRIYENGAERGGGVYTKLSYSPVIQRCTIFGNLAGYGGGIYAFCGGSNVRNCTITQNQASKVGSGLVIWANGNELRMPSIVNSILWDNASPFDRGGPQIYIQAADDPRNINLSYSDVQGGLEGIQTSNGGYVDWGEGNIRDDPLFLDPSPAVRDFSLSEGSPCINTGTDIELPFNGDAPDMGAAEYGILPPVLVEVPLDYETIQEAIDAVEDGDVILVEPGDYFENINFNGKDITIASWFDLNGDPINIEETVIDGGGEGSVVTFDHDETNNAVLKGFTIRNGKGTNTSPHNVNHMRGGGIYLTGSSSPVITDCIITENHLDWEPDEGPAQDESPTWVGGGVSIEFEASPLILNCIITDNSAFSYGGGISISGFSNMRMTGCVISNNTSAHGAGATCGGDSTVIIEDCIFEDNHAVNFLDGSNSAGGLALTRGTVSRCIFRNNDAQSGGGIYLNCYESALIERCQIYNNTAQSGAGIYNQNSLAQIVNCTIADNLGETGGGVFYQVFQYHPELASMTNCIIWGNEPEQVHLNDNYLEGNIEELNIRYSDIQGGEDGFTNSKNRPVLWGDGNIDSDPVFTDIRSNDYRLTAESPCIDAGIDAGFEFTGDAPDMGAIEWEAPDSVEPEGKKGALLSDRVLISSYPNPFNAITTIGFTIVHAAQVSMKIYNSTGREVASLNESYLDRGTHKLSWSAEGLPAGVYLVRLQTPAETQVRKLTLVR